MEMRAFGETARALFCVCTAVAMTELLAGEGCASRPFRSVCALAATLCALRMVSRLL